MFFEIRLTSLAKYQDKKDSMKPHFDASILSFCYLNLTEEILMFNVVLYFLFY